MSLREIVSDGCFIGWPTITCPRANRQVIYLYLEVGEEAVSEELENGNTIVRVSGRGVHTSSPGLEPVIIRRPRTAI
jgi:hypothetical protein